MRKESADTQEYEAHHVGGMDVDMDESEEELIFVPSAVSDSAGWHELKFRCDRQCRKEGFKFFDIASAMVEDDGEPSRTRETFALHATMWHKTRRRARG